jgi:hypothetical protein
MKKRFALSCGLAASILLTGCYNNPNVSLRKPGEGSAHIHGGPAVGPGTVAGGSTAGPQPTPVAHNGDVTPMPGGGHPAQGNDGHSQPATPVHGTEKPAFESHEATGAHGAKAATEKH